MARAKLSVTHTPGLGAMFRVSDKDGDGLTVRKHEAVEGCSFATFDSGGNSIICNLTAHQLACFLDFANTHLKG